MGLRRYGTIEIRRPSKNKFENKKEEGPAKNLLYKEKVIFLKSSINQLPEREKLVISLYYQEDLNLKEIGAVLKITESRVSQLRTKAIAMIRSYMDSFAIILVSLERSRSQPSNDTNIVQNEIIVH